MKVPLPITSPLFDEGHGRGRPRALYLVRAGRQLCCPCKSSGDDDGVAMTSSSPASPPPPSAAAIAAAGGAPLSPASVAASRPPSHIYYTTSRGATGGVGGVSGTVFVELGGYAKVSSIAGPYVVVNELVAFRLAAAVGLPVPPGCLIHDAAGSRMG